MDGTPILSTERPGDLFSYLYEFKEVLPYFDGASEEADGMTADFHAIAIALAPQFSAAL